MIITTITRNWVKSISLPDRIRGQYWLQDEQNRHVISVEGIQNQWVMKSSRFVQILDTDRHSKKTEVLTDNRIYELLTSEGERICVFTEPNTDDRRTYTKYWIEEGTDISLGRSEKNDVCYSGDGVSASHASLRREGMFWYIRDLGSINGTFVNGQKIKDKELNPGDLVYILGLKIVIGSDYIAVNNPDGRAHLSSKLYRFEGQHPETVEQDEIEEQDEAEYFYRSPRFKRDVETAVFKIDPPPASPITEELPWMLMMGSSLAMGVVSMTTLGMAIANQNIMSMVMGGSMLTGTLLMPSITKAYEKKRKKEKEIHRQEKYRSYLKDVSNKIQEVSRLQEEILNENGVSIQECEKRILETDRKLWERAPGQNDFLQVRIGNGNRNLDAEFHYPERRFTLTEDVLLDEQYALCEKEKRLHNIPITYSLYDNPISGVIGDRERVRALAKSWIIQLAALYSYDEVKFVFLYDRKSEEFDFVKWLPHIWSNDRKFRFLATDSAEAAEISAYFDPIIDAREQMNDSDLEKLCPYYIIFAMSRKLTIRTEFIRKILTSGKKLQCSLITFCEELKDLPKECSMIVELDQVSGKLFDKNDITGKYVGFTPDSSLRSSPLKLSRTLANTYLNTEEEHFKLPAAVPFLGMYGVGKVEHLNALDRWKEHDPTKSLRAEVGIDTYGSTFMLDLHENIHGPHGLVAGMTGSGKSEFLITYILSLAVNYHPNEVAFILIDYKGGGTAKAFENLPHTAGIITNLDGSAIKRSLVSIESELKRRQEIFARVSKKVGISNIDIYKYQKLFRDGKVPEPLQHLFIIADEFAELKTQQPEFMSQLISAARIGRSLGIHLILATQKPSGVVDDQIWSNSRFRVCLKVQERADSVDMLKRPEAAELTDVGRFYLQVGYNELFELGQSAWSGAPYEPSDRPTVDRDRSIEVIDTNGHVIKRVKPIRKKSGNSKFGKQLDAVVDYLKGIAEEENIHIRQLWLEPIPAVIILDQIRKKYDVQARRFWLNPLIGVYDDPSHQQQCALCLPLSQEGNAIIYGSAGSGKTSFLNAMICSLIQEHTPDEVQLYLLDFSAETLHAFANAPHVGDVILNYETEKVRNLFKMLHKEINRRRKLFTDYGGDYSAYLQNSGSSLPAVVTVIHNFTAFSELFAEQEDAITLLSREGTKYGVYFVLTSVGSGSVRFRLQQNFKQLITMQQNDPTEYSSIVGKTEGLCPADFKGRGLIRQGGLYEFQTASLTERENQLDVIREICAEADAAWNGNRAPHVPVLPETVDTEFLLPQMDHRNVLNIPIGVEKNSLQVHYYPFGSICTTMVESEHAECVAFVSQLGQLLGKSGTISGFALDPLGTMDVTESGFSVYTTEKDCNDRARELYQLVLQRNHAYKDAQTEEKPQPVFDPVLVILNSYAALKANLSDESSQMLSVTLDKNMAVYGVSIVIAEPSKQMKNCRYEPWYQNQISSGDGIWIGSGMDRQSAMEPSGRASWLHDELPPDEGYSLRNGKCVRLKLLGKKKEEQEDEP